MTTVGAEPSLVLDHRDESKVYQIGEIRLVDPWVKSPLGAHHLKLFFEFRNHGDANDRLISAQSPIATKQTQFFAVESDEKSMIGLAEISAIDMPASDRSFELSESGYYIQLNGLSQPVVMGASIPIVLVFERAGMIKIDVAARFHSPKLHRRIKDAVDSGDIETLRAIRPK